MKPKFVYVFSIESYFDNYTIMNRIFRNKSLGNVSFVLTANEVRNFQVNTNEAEQKLSYLLTLLGDVDASLCSRTLRTQQLLSL